MSARDRLSELARRVEMASLHPHLVKAPLTRLARPVLARFGWQPKLSIERMKGLVVTLRGVGTGDAGGALKKAIDELEDNLQAVERLTVIRRQSLVQHNAWLRTQIEHLSTALTVVEDQGNRVARRLVAEADEAMLLPPLQVATDVEDDPDVIALKEDPSLARLMELQVAAVDHLMEAARKEPDLHARRRRLLEAARQILVETSAAVPLDKAAVHARLQSIGSQITRINRMQAAGLNTDVAILHQVRTALSRGERQKLHLALTALDEAAVMQGDERLLRLTDKALRKLREDAHSDGKRDEVNASADDMFGEEIVDGVAKAYEVAREKLEEHAVRTKTKGTLFYDLTNEYLAPGAERATLSASLSVDGCFDVGGALAPARVLETERRIQVVSHPTQDLVLVPAMNVTDLPNALIDDPRSILMSLATGRLLARKFVRTEVKTRQKTVMRGEVRVYVLDGSESMIGPRARLRDAILIAELATLMRRLNDPNRRTRVVLFYRYFDEELGPVTRVDSPERAFASISDVIATIRRGGTDIEKALLASFDQIEQAQQEDKDLARAQIVLVTDGEADVNAEKVMARHRALGDLQVGVSVIALGEENPALRAIVTRQRREGARAFYHFIDDAQLGRINRGNNHEGPAIHLPAFAVDMQKPPAELARELEKAVGDSVEEMAALQHTRAGDAIQGRKRPAADTPVEELTSMAGEGADARVEALHKDERALAIRFNRWFPAAQPEATKVLPQEGTVEHADLDAVQLLLSTVVEVLEVVDGTPLTRRADAIDLLERMLPDAKLTPGRYLAVVRMYARAVAPGLAAIHGIVTGGIAVRLRKKVGV